MKSELAAKRFFLALLLGSIVLLGMVIYPMAKALVLAAAFAGLLWPLQLRLLRKLKKRPSLAAGILVGGVVLLILAPLVAMSAFIVKEGSESVQYITETLRSEGFNGLLEKLPPSLQHLVHEAFELIPHPAGTDVGETVQKQVTAQGGNAAGAVGAAVSATGSALIQTVLMLIALFFLLVQGNELLDWLDEASPLRKGQTQELLGEIKKVSYSVITSTVITSAVQAVAALIGYLIARVPHPIFFAAITFVIAFVPAVGAGSVCLGAAVLLLATGHSYMALFLAIWGVVVVGLVDNVVKPLLIKGGMEMHGAVVFFALLGGLAAFGAVGLLIGPLVVALFLSLLRMYRRDFSGTPAPAPAASGR